MENAFGRGTFMHSGGQPVVDGSKHSIAFNTPPQNAFLSMPLEARDEGRDKPDMVISIS